MKRFYEDSSQAKTLTNSRAIRRAMKYLTPDEKFGYELRWYYDRNRQYEVYGVYTTRKAVEVAKSFYEMQYGHTLCIVYTGKIPKCDIDFDQACRSL